MAPPPPPPKKPPVAPPSAPPVDYSVLDPAYRAEQSKRFREELPQEKRDRLDALERKVEWAGEGFTLLRQFPSMRLDEVLKKIYVGDVPKITDEATGKLIDDPRAILKRGERLEGKDHLKMNWREADAAFINAIGFSPFDDDYKELWSHVSHMPLQAVTQLVTQGLLDDANKGLSPSQNLLQRRAAPPQGVTVKRRELFRGTEPKPTEEIEEEFSAAKRLARYFWQRDHPDAPFSPGHSQQDQLDTWHDRTGMTAASEYERRPMASYPGLIRDSIPPDRRWRLDVRPSEILDAIKQANPHPATLGLEKMGVTPERIAELGRIWDDERKRFVEEFKVKAFIDQRDAGKWPKGVVVGLADDFSSVNTEVVEGSAEPLVERVDEVVEPLPRREVERYSPEGVDLPTSIVPSFYPGFKREIQAGLKYEEKAGATAWAGEVPGAVEYARLKAKESGRHWREELRDMWMEHRDAMTQAQSRMKKSFDVGGPVPGEPLTGILLSDEEIEENLINEERKKYSDFVSMDTFRKDQAALDKDIEAWRQEADPVRTTQAAAEAAAGLPLRVVSMLAGGILEGIPTGATEVLAAELSGVPPESLRVLEKATKGERDDVLEAMLQDPRVRTDVLQKLEKLYVTRDGGFEGMAASEEKMMEEMAGLDLSEAIVKNGNLIIEGLAQLPVMVLGPTGKGWMDLGDTPIERIGASLNEARKQGYVLGLGTVLAFYNMARSPKRYFKANPWDALTFAGPILKALQAKGALQHLTGRAKQAVETTIRLADELDRKKQAFFKSRHAKLGTIPWDVISKTLRVTGDVVRGTKHYMGEGMRRISAFLDNPYAQKEWSASIFLEEATGARPVSALHLDRIQGEFASLMSEGKRKEAAHFLRKELEETFGPGWEALSDTHAEFANGIHMIELLDEAAAHPSAKAPPSTLVTRGEDLAAGLPPVEGYAAAQAAQVAKAPPPVRITPDAPEVPVAAVAAVEEVAPSPAAVVPMEKLETPPLYGDQALKNDRYVSRVHHPDWVARRIIWALGSGKKVDLNQMATMMHANPEAVAASLARMMDEGNAYPGMTRPEGSTKKNKKSLSDAGAFDPTLVPDRQKLSPREAAELLESADKRLAQGLADKGVLAAVIEDLRTGYQKMDHEGLKKMGFSDAQIKEMTTRYGLLPGKLKDKGRPDAGFYARKGEVAKTPEVKIERVSPPEGDVGPTVNDRARMYERERDIAKELGIELPPLKMRERTHAILAEKINAAREANAWKRQRTRLEEAPEVVVPQKLEAEYTPSPEVRARANKALEGVGTNLKDLKDTLKRDPTSLEIAILGRDMKKVRELLGGEGLGVIERMVGTMDVAHSPIRNALDNSIRDFQIRYVNTVSDKGALLKKVDHDVAAAFSSLQKKIVRERRGNSLRREASIGFEEAVTRDIVEGNKVFTLPAALKEDPTILLERIGKGGDLRNTLWSKAEANGVTPRQFEINMKDLERRLKSYVKLEDVDFLKKRAAIGQWTGMKAGDPQLYVPKSLRNQMAWEEVGMRAYSLFTSFAKRGMTSKNISSLVNNYSTAAMSQFIRRGELLDPLTLIKRSQDFLDDLTPQSLGMSGAEFVRHKRMVEALRKRDFIERGAFEVEFGGTTKYATDADTIKAIPGQGGGLSELAKKIHDKSIGKIEKAYGKTDQLFKWEEAKHSFKHIDEMWDGLSDSSGGKTKFLELEVTAEGRTARLRKVNGKAQVYDQRSKSWRAIDDEALAKLQADAAAVTAERLFFDYSKLPNIGKVNRMLAAATGIGAPFFTWFWKAMYVPGIKRGLPRELLSGLPYTLTNDANIAKAAAKKELKNMVRMQAALQMTRDRMEGIPKETLRSIFSHLPGEAKARMFQRFAREDLMGVKDLEYLSLFDPSALALNVYSDVADGLYRATFGEARLDDTSLFNAAWVKTPDGIDIGLDNYRNEDGSLNAEGQEILVRRNYVRKKLGGSDTTGFDVTTLIGLGASPVLDLATAVGNISDTSKGGTDRALRELRKFAMTYALGGTVEKGYHLLAGEIEKSGTKLHPGLASDFLREMKKLKAPTFSRLNEMGVNVLRESMRKITGLGFKIKHIGDSKRKYLRKIQSNWRKALLKDQREEMGNLRVEGGEAFEKRDKPAVDRIKAYKKQIEGIIASEVDLLDRKITRILNLMAKTKGRGPKSRRRRSFTWKQISPGNYRKEYFDIDKSGKRKVIDDEFLDGQFKVEEWGGSTNPEDIWMEKHKGISVPLGKEIYTAPGAKRSKKPMGVIEKFEAFEPKRGEPSIYPEQ